MKGFSKRERDIISRVYYDAARICWERKNEPYNSKKDGIQMAGDLRRIILVRKSQILRYGCDLPSQRYTSRKP